MNKCIFCHLKTLVGCVALLSLLSIQKLEAQNFDPLQTAQQDSTSTLNEAQPVRISTARTRKQQENNSNDRGITVRAKNNARLLQPKTAQTPWKSIMIDLLPYNVPSTQFYDKIRRSVQRFLSGTGA